MELNQWPLHYPFAEQAVFVLKEKKKRIYCWTRSRPTWTFGESDDQVRDKSESKYQRVQDKSETIEKRLETGLEYYSPNNAYIHSTQTDTFQGFISFNFDDYNWQLMKTPNSVSQKIIILWKGSILKTPGATL